MPGSGNNGTVRTLVTACSVRSEDVYQRYVSGLYLQALLTLGDSALAVRVVFDVIADECALAPGAGGARVGAYRRSWVRPGQQSAANLSA